jgi:ABC-type transport system involved in cytochrome c biogenesis ATPase subunit
MKLLGVELANFACFDRQFIPLRPGINLLVGKNNAGKTAVLRALSVLGALPVGNVQPIATELSGYCRGGSPTFALDLLYRAEESDADFFHLPEMAKSDHLLGDTLQKGLLRELRSEDAIAHWRFKVFGANRQVGFLDLTFELPAGEEGSRSALVLTKNASGNPLLRRMQYPNLVSDASTLVGNTTFSAPDGLYPIFEPSGLSAPLQVFGTIKLINPHRVPHARQALQSVSNLTGDAGSLGPYLQTLQGNDRETFEKIETFVTRVFPEFRFINAASRENNQVSIDLTERATGRKIPLENCGTGVEQIIILATFVLTTPKPGTILLDEPHSYLHPTAERALVQFLQEHPEHYFVVSTHSAVLMNSVTPDRITHISPPGRAYDPTSHQAQTASILFDLGYRNSDALFYDRLVFVEGKSDKQIVPILLEKDGEIDNAELARTGFPAIEGIGKGSTAVQTSILRHEKLLSAVGRTDQPRVYILDGDRRDDEKTVIQGTKHPKTLAGLAIKFLPRPEIENYLLVPEAIAPAVREELVLKGEPRDISVEEVKQRLDRLLREDKEGQSPRGESPVDGAPTDAKGSEILERLYDNLSLRYNKESSGILIAKHLTASTQPAISDLTELVRSIFPRHPKTNGAATAAPRNLTPKT